MSLHYIIDGYNLIHHPRARSLSKRASGPEAGLLHLIRNNSLCGKPSNKITVVFDGYKDMSGESAPAGVEAVFSYKLSADEKIRRILEGSGGAKNIIVVSDDREVAFFARQARAKPMSVEEFLAPKAKGKGRAEEAEEEGKLTYSEMHKINQELKKMWLK